MEEGVEKNERFRERQKRERGMEKSKECSLFFTRQVKIGDKILKGRRVEKRKEGEGEREENVDKEVEQR